MLSTPPIDANTKSSILVCERPFLGGAGAVVDVVFVVAPFDGDVERIVDPLRRKEWSYADAEEVVEVSSTDSIPIAESEDSGAGVVLGFIVRPGQSIVNFPSASGHLHVHSKSMQPFGRVV